MRMAHNTAMRHYFTVSDFLQTSIITIVLLL